jgi:hypothetical protein
MSDTALLTVTLFGPLLAICATYYYAAKWAKQASVARWLRGSAIMAVVLLGLTFGTLIIGFAFCDLAEFGFRNCRGLPTSVANKAIIATFSGIPIGVIYAFILAIACLGSERRARLKQK